MTIDGENSNADLVTIIDEECNNKDAPDTYRSFFRTARRGIEDKNKIQTERDAVLLMAQNAEANVQKLTMIYATAQEERLQENEKMKQLELSLAAMTNQLAEAQQNSTVLQKLINEQKEQVRVHAQKLAQRDKQILTLQSRHTPHNQPNPQQNNDSIRLIQSLQDENRRLAASERTMSEKYQSSSLDAKATVQRMQDALAQSRAQAATMRQNMEKTMVEQSRELERLRDELEAAKQAGSSQEILPQLKEELTRLRILFEFIGKSQEGQLLINNVFEHPDFRNHVDQSLSRFV
ncbi:hypothetical protein DM01DRAFT_314471 [Hesseltinella vesiculosa]|uniref:Uncharacterized protein n=1 Tax=Hesseltinella vesiculosa TaxID=101127 RepID=A0A1X2GNT5_9FUNG|nr:hypothetical protein DM01DRAFT_314471 [Hesseltinella vesiculosa]